jgi:hypothetical protein
VRPSDAEEGVTDLTPAEAARRLLVDAPGQALCDSCLAFACSTGLVEMREITNELLKSVRFLRREACVSCRQTVPATAYRAKCPHCSLLVQHGEKALVFEHELFHAACLRVRVSEEAIRATRGLDARYRRLIEDARRQIRDRRTAPPLSES